MTPNGVPLEKYYDWVKANVMTDPAIRRINDSLHNRLKSRYPKRKEEIESWLQDLWVKWCQARLKHIRRQNQFKSATPPLTEPKSSPRTEFHLGSSPLPRSRLSEPVGVQTRTSAIEKYQGPAQYASRSIQLLFESGHIPSVLGLIHSLLAKYEKPTPLAIKSMEAMIQDAGEIPSIPGLIHWLLQNFDTILPLRDIDPNGMDENYAEPHQDDVISLPLFLTSRHRILLQQMMEKRSRTRPKRKRKRKSKSKSKRKRKRKRKKRTSRGTTTRRTRRWKRMLRISSLQMSHRILLTMIGKLWTMSFQQVVLSTPTNSCRWYNPYNSSRRG